jgi:hypothetical protein
MSRVSSRGLLRNEVQDLLHECFNYSQQLESFATSLMAPDQEDHTNVAHELQTAAARLRDVHEELRARILPLLG